MRAIIFCAILLYFERFRRESLEIRISPIDAQSRPRWTGLVLLQSGGAREGYYHDDAAIVVFFI